MKNFINKMLKRKKRTTHSISLKKENQQPVSSMPVNNNIETKHQTFIAYGFDALGFETQSGLINVAKNISVEFVSLDDSRKLDNCDGVITIQGIFEELKYDRTSFGEPLETGTFKIPLLLERERQLLNLLNKNGCVCFLVRQINDCLYQREREIDIRENDLCKRFLNNLNINRQLIDATASVEAKVSEFNSYLKDFGVAMTVFYTKYDTPENVVTIATSNNHIVGIAYDTKMFFLPFHTTKRDSDTAKVIVEKIIIAIVDYRQKWQLDIPSWANEFKFNHEQDILSEIDRVNYRSAQLGKELSEWQEYKGILVSSGELLKKRIINILTVYLGLKIDPIDEKREDAKILNDENKVLALIECKGVKTGVKREHINQVDSHRERNNLDANSPGILIINNEMSLNSISDRLKTEIASEHVIHAKNANVLIIRTIDLLHFMKKIEKEDKSTRNKMFMEVVNKGGGWLNAPSSIETVEIK